MKLISEIKWREVQSGMIDSISYDAKEEALYIMFKRSFDVWMYKGVTKNDWSLFKNSESVGKHFLSKIKPSKDGVKVTE